MSNSRIDNELRFQQTALGLRAQRQQLIASNIANADTPNFKAQDLDFKSALRDALGGGSPNSQPLELKTTHGRHIAAQAPVDPSQGHVKFRGELQSSVDGNTVDMDTERAAFAENTLQYNSGLTFVNDTIKGLRLAINGQ
jgi:flagellar basal-body rod protein FlgB